MRSLFKSINIEEGQERLPWLSLNDTNNKAYMALPVGGDITACRVMLSLNLSWNSWSTIASSAPFNACGGLQVLNSTFLIHKNRLTGDVQVLDMDASHHLDFAVNMSNTALVATHTYQRSLNTTTTYPNKVVKLLHDTPPTLKEYTGTPTVIKVATSYITTSTLAQEMTPRNWMFDVPELTPLLGASTDSPLGSDIALYTPASQLTVYPLITARTNTTVTFGTSRTVNGDTASTISYMGTIYPSIFSTTPFNASSLGRLKRLKRLHLLFDSTSVTDSQYADYSSVHQNSAVAVVTSNYQQQDFIADYQLIGDYVNLDALLLDVTPSIRERDQLSIPLQGFGCDYQLYLCSTGGDAFKLVSYEFDVQPQRTKTYVAP